MKKLTKYYTLTNSTDKIIEVLKENTLEKNYLTLEFTPKKFIGHFYKNHFSLLNSNMLQIGMFCILKGHFEERNQNTYLEVRTRIHTAFIILGSIFITLFSILFFVLSAKSFPMPNPILFLIGNCFWISLLSASFFISRHFALKQLETSIEIKCSY